MTDPTGAMLVAVENSDTAKDVWLVPERPGLITPTSVRVNWRDVPEHRAQDALDNGWCPDPLTILGDILRVADALVPDHLLGRPLLATWSLRRNDGGLVAAVAPGFTDGTSDWDGPYGDPPEPGVGRDLYLLGAVLFRVVCGRWPQSRRDATQTAAVIGGSWPPGIELAVRLCCAPDPTHGAADAAHLADAVRALTAPRASGASLRTTVGLESMTGWRKSHGRPRGDNEDTVLWDRLPGRTVALVADGVTGGSVGTGRIAAALIGEQARSAWSTGDADPARLLTACDDTLRAHDIEGSERPAATAMALTVSDIGQLRLASVGDSLAFLCRPSSRSVIVTRLNAEHSRLAQRLHAGEPLQESDSGVVLMACGAGQPLLPHSVTLDLLPGDRLVLATDGATKADAGDDGRRCWQFVNLLAELVGSDPYPALLASLLCRRADELGGYDNATVFVLAVTDSADQNAEVLRVSNRVRRVESGLA